jgi:hypothetical protein
MHRQPVQGLAWSVHWSHGQHSRGRSARLKVDRSLMPTHSALIDEAVSWSGVSISPLAKRIPADMISGQGEAQSCVVDWNQDSRQYRADQSEGVQHAPIVYPSIPVVEHWSFRSPLRFPSNQPAIGSMFRFLNVRDDEPRLLTKCMENLADIDMGHKRKLNRYI